ncbi:MAG: hypothetical protein M1831_006036 [Alyxoria varia]|nr:MAG: hypothetical protein M1831_006036 [Alyxoria varia]
MTNTDQRLNVPSPPPPALTPSINNNPNPNSPPNPHSTSADRADPLSESEYEYEYHPTETVTTYLTLDLTTHVPPHIRRSDEKKVQKTKRRAERYWRRKKREQVDPLGPGRGENENKITDRANGVGGRQGGARADSVELGDGQNVDRVVERGDERNEGENRREDDAQQSRDQKSRQTDSVFHDAQAQENVQNGEARQVDRPGSDDINESGQTAESREQGLQDPTLQIADGVVDDPDDKHHEHDNGQAEPVANTQAQGHPHDQQAHSDIHRVDAQDHNPSAPQHPDTAGEPSHTSAVNANTTTALQEPRLSEKEKEPDPDAPEPLKILDLHTYSPLIVYRGRLYRCEWATGLGTDMIYSRASEDKDESAGAARDVDDPSNQEGRAGDMRRDGPQQPRRPSSEATTSDGIEQADRANQIQPQPVNRTERGAQPSSSTGHSDPSHSTEPTLKITRNGHDESPSSFRTPHDTASPSRPPDQLADRPTPPDPSSQSTPTPKSNQPQKQQTHTAHTLLATTRARLLAKPIRLVPRALEPSIGGRKRKRDNLPEATSQRMPDEDAAREEKRARRDHDPVQELDGTSAKGKRKRKRTDEPAEGERTDVESKRARHESSSASESGSQAAQPAGEDESPRVRDSQPGVPQPQEVRQEPEQQPAEVERPEAEYQRQPEAPEQRDRPSFLRQLAALKRFRGETDTVPLTPIPGDRSGSPPPGAPSGRARHVKVDFDLTMEPDSARHMPTLSSNNDGQAEEEEEQEDDEEQAPAAETILHQQEAATSTSRSTSTTTTPTTSDPSTPSSSTSHRDDLPASASHHLHPHRRYRHNQPDTRHRQRRRRRRVPDPPSADPIADPAADPSADPYPYSSSDESFDPNLVSDNEEPEGAGAGAENVSPVGSFGGSDEEGEDEEAVEEELDGEEFEWWRFADDDDDDDVPRDHRRQEDLEEEEENDDGDEGDDDDAGDDDSDGSGGDDYDDGEEHDSALDEDAGNSEAEDNGEETALEGTIPGGDGVPWNRHELAEMRAQLASAVGTSGQGDEDDDDESDGEDGEDDGGDD